MGVSGMAGTALPPTATTRGRNATPLSLWLLGLLVAAAVGILVGAEPAETATTFTVNSTGDAEDRKIFDAACDTSRKRGKQCTLRAALQEANDTDGTDTINFNIGGSASVKTISPGSLLPDIEESVSIDAYSQPGAKRNTRALGSNAVLKVELDGGRVEAGGTGLDIVASNVSIKGLVINRWGLRPVHIRGGSNNLIQGNFIGTDPSGTVDQNTGVQGVLIHKVASSLAVSDNLVGGPTPQARNLISGAVVAGVAIFEDDNRIEGNYIGTTADGNGALGNSGEGVVVFGANNTVGGADSGVGNHIAHNGAAGVAVSGPGNSVLSNRIFQNDGGGVVVSGSTDNAILSNRISANGGLGIDLGNDDITNNDRDDDATTVPDADLDSGPNDLQNFPRLISADLNPATGLTTIAGEIESVPGQSYLIEVYLAGTVEDDDPSGHGEGPRLVGRQVVRILANDPDSAAPFAVSGIEGVGPDQQATATATRIDTSSGTQIPESTSEFAQNHNVT
jgi:CSLREA domain-containing protein